MTPKEKAKELVYKYQDLVTSWNCYYDIEIPISDRISDMKECAMICVDEIITLLNEIPTTINCHIIPFWQEVKTEIKNL